MDGHLFLFVYANIYGDIKSVSEISIKGGGGVYIATLLRLSVCVSYSVCVCVYVWRSGSLLSAPCSPPLIAHHIIFNPLPPRGSRRRLGLWSPAQWGASSHTHTCTQSPSCTRVLKHLDTHTTLLGCRHLSTDTAWDGHVPARTLAGRETLPCVFSFNTRHPSSTPPPSPRQTGQYSPTQGQPALPCTPPISTVALVVPGDPNPAGHHGSPGCKWTDTNYSKQHHIRECVCVWMCVCTCMQVAKLDRLNSRKREVHTPAASSNQGPLIVRVDRHGWGAAQRFWSQGLSSIFSLPLLNI